MNQIFFPFALVQRVDDSEQPKVVTRSIICPRCLRGQSPEALNVLPDRATRLLI
jgi:hypothetical protein